MDFFFNFKGNLSNEAIKGAGAVDTLTNALKAEERALKAAEVAGARLKAAGEISIKPFKAAVQARQNITALKTELAAMGGQPAPTFFATIGKSRGPIGGLVKDARALGEAFAGNKWAMAAIGIVAVTGAVIGLGRALVSGAIDAGTFALKLADAGRNTRLLNEAADIAGGTHSQLGAIIKQVAQGPTTVAKGRIGEMARELRILRFDSRQTQLAVSAMAIAESALGQGASGAIKGIAEQSREARKFVLGARDMYGEYQGLKGTGLGKRDVFAHLAKSLGLSLREAEDRFRRGGVTIRQGLEAIETATRAKFGGVAEQQVLSLDNQFGRLKEDIGGLFAGVNLGPFLKGLKGVTSMLSDTTAGGRQTRLTITAALDELAAKAAKVFPYIESFLYGVGTGALTVYNESIKPMIDGLSADLEGGGIEGAFKAGETAAKALAETLAGILNTINSIISAGQKISHAIDVVSSPFETAKKDAAAKEQKAFDIAFTGRASSAKEATDAGVQLTAGITKGIHIGTPEAVSAMSALGDSMLAAFKARNKIQSPSKLYEEQAAYIPAGSARGIRKGTPEVQAAIDDMGSPSGVRTSAKGGSSFYATLAIDLRYPDGEVRREIRSVLFEASSGGPRAEFR